jgi:hypothetical protein
LLVGPGIVGVLSWLIATIFAALAILYRQSSLRYAAVALGINCVTGAYLAFAQ